MHFTQPIPLTLYVHYPWCIQKCPYCDFNSHNLKEDQEARYLSALIKQLEATLPQIWGRPIQAIFFGGGTPSLMSEAGLAQFLSQARALLGFGPDIEVTLEANPGTVDFEKFAGFRQAGINRLSMGIQSFSDEKLKALGRIHSADEAYQAVEAAKQAGFDNFNLDLMFALPNQTLAEALYDVETAMGLQPPHLSHYQLTLEPNTPFFRDPPTIPNDDLAWEMQSSCQKLIADNGYQHYEVSGYAQKNKQCAHNLNYWRYGDYIGLGAGAHGKITLPPEGRILRTQMPASPGSYMNLIESGATGRVSEVSEQEAMLEFMMNALRLQSGVEVELFSLRTGIDLKQMEPKLLNLKQKNWFTESNERIQLTPIGQRYLNEVLQEFLED